MFLNSNNKFGSKYLDPDIPNKVENVTNCRINSKPIYRSFRAYLHPRILGI